MRNALAHACFNIDWDAIWLVVIRDLPNLEAELRVPAAALAHPQLAPDWPAFVENVVRHAAALFRTTRAAHGEPVVVLVDE
jgi:hypothetical protein